MKTPLKSQIQGLKDGFAIPRPEWQDILAVLLIGSCARGEATYRSDVDLLIVLKSGPLDFGRIREIRDRVEEGFGRAEKATLLNEPLPTQMTVVLPSVFDTKEPAMREAIRAAVSLFDPNGELAMHLGKGAA